MVYLKRDLPLPSEKEGEDELDNTYWAIGHTAAETESMKLSHRDYRPKPLSADEMILREDRRERGLLDYEKCLVRELKGFIQARKLKLPKGGRVHKEHLIQVLEQADEELEFPKLFDLPTELRDNIYEKYFDALPSLPLQPHQPPLTLVPLLRTESLPLYYNNCTFTFDFHIGARWGGRFHGLQNTTVISNDTTSFLGRLSKQDFARIRRIKLRLWEIRSQWNRKLKVHESIAVKVATWGADLYASTELDSTYRFSRNDWFLISLDTVDRVLERMIDVIRERPSEERFNKSDLGDFRREMNLVQLE